MKGGRKDEGIKMQHERVNGDRWSVEWRLIFDDFRARTLFNTPSIDRQSTSRFLRDIFCVSLEHGRFVSRSSLLLGLTVGRPSVISTRDDNRRNAFSNFDTRKNEREGRNDSFCRRPHLSLLKRRGVRVYHSWTRPIGNEIKVVAIRTVKFHENSSRFTDYPGRIKRIPERDPLKLGYGRPSSHRCRISRRRDPVSWFGNDRKKRGKKGEEKGNEGSTEFSEGSKNCRQFPERLRR